MLSGFYQLKWKWKRLSNSRIENLAYLRLETHVKHSISLVQNKVRHIWKFQTPHWCKIIASSGCGYNDIDTVLKLSNLNSFGRPSIHTEMNIGEQKPKLDWWTIFVLQDKTGKRGKVWEKLNSWRA